MAKQVSGIRAKQLVEGKLPATLVDLCSPVSFRDGGIPGSRNVSLRQLSVLQRELKKQSPVVVMGDADDEKTLPAALNYIEGYGFTQVFWIKSRAEYGK